MTTDAGTRGRGDAETIQFTTSEIEVLRISAEMTGQYLKSAGLHFKPYQIKRYEFALEWNKDNVFHTKRTRVWAEKIKRELKGAREMMRSKSFAAPAAGTTSGSACGSDI